MKKKFTSVALFLTLAFGIFGGSSFLASSNVEALPALTDLCAAKNASIRSTSEAYPTCVSATTIAFTFDYNFSVIGVSSGADGY